MSHLPLDVPIEWAQRSNEPGLYLVARDKDGRGAWVLEGVIRVVRGPRGGRRKPRWLCWPKAEARLPDDGVMYARLTGPTWGHLVPFGDQSDGPEPGQTICHTHCPCCGAAIEVMHGDHGGFGVLSDCTRGDER